MSEHSSYLAHTMHLQVVVCTWLTAPNTGCHLP